ncbi:MAG TPA: holo-ACP synthase [Oligoflexia bacterium]|nr:holo-ACP synthase [Oligoflexia bacterium]
MSIVGIGIDIERVDRFKMHLDQANARFFQRLFSSAEIDYCMAKKHPELHFTARFCAKEAFVKACANEEKFKITDIQVQKDGDKPHIAIWQKETCSKALLDFFKSRTVMLSLSHSQDYACAQVIIQNKQG